MDNLTITHVYPEPQNESVKLEKNSRGYNYEIKAPSVERAFEIEEQVRQKVAALEQNGGK